MVCTHTYLLVGIEGNAYVAMLNLVVVAEETHSLDNLGDAGLVVGTEESGAVGDDEILSNMVEQFGEAFW